MRYGPVVTTDAASLLKRLPPVPRLEQRCVALAMLDALLSPAWESRYYSFNRFWDRDAGSRMASYRDGCGDDYFILFSPDGRAAIKGFDHEAFGGGAVPGVLDGLPDSFADFRDEPAFSMDDTTFCLWNAGSGWERSRSLSNATVEQDGSARMLALLVGTPADYVAHARDNFEIDVDEDIVARFFDLEPLTPALAGALHSHADLEAIDDLDDIGYPTRAPE